MSVSVNGNVTAIENVTIATGTLTRWVTAEGVRIDVTQKMLNIHVSVLVTRPGHAATIGSRTSGMIDMTGTETETEKQGTMIA